MKQEIGLEINERCKHCGNHTKRHINRLHADSNYINILGGILLAIIVTILFWDLGFLSSLSFSIPFTIWMIENKKASTFNKVLIRD
ncbi:MAG: hypothetical protein ABJQ50_18665 [Algibacter sp.]